MFYFQTLLLNQGSNDVDVVHIGTEDIPMSCYEYALLHDIKFIFAVLEIPHGPGLLGRPELLQQSHVQTTVPNNFYL